MPSTELPWHARIRLSTDEVTRLGREAFGFPCDQIALLGEGWDFFNYLADDEWVLRFPKRAECDGALLREKTILNELNGWSLPIRVPDMEHLSDPLHDYPWHFAAYRFIPGTPLDRIERSTKFSWVTDAIGEFLSVLHGRPIQPLKSPWDDTDDAWRRREYEGAIDAYPEHLRRPVEMYLEEGPPAEPDLQHVLTHSDLNLEHILVDESARRVTGIIDWADACTSFRSIDLVGLYYWGGSDWVAATLSAMKSEPIEGEVRWLKHAAIGICIGYIYYGWHSQREDLLVRALRRLEALINNRGL